MIFRNANAMARDAKVRHRFLKVLNLDGFLFL